VPAGPPLRLALPRRGNARRESRTLIGCMRIHRCQSDGRLR
jgi:hypothetical protein